jgi:hypothetical protein
MSAGNDEQHGQRPEEATEQPGPGYPTDDTSPPQDAPGRANAEATPPISDEDQTRKGETQRPAPPDDVGV